MSSGMRWTIQTILELPLVMTLIRKAWRPDVRTPEETGQLLSEVIVDRELEEKECQYWAGDLLKHPSRDVLNTELRAKIWKETQAYFVKHGLVDKTLDLR
jgi:hypothetical protein